MKLDDVILREIGALTRTIHAIIEIKFKELNLQKGQSIYLTRICENPGLTMKELSQLLMVDKTTTSKVVQKLIVEGLVSKDQDPQDKRSYHLAPTVKTKEVYAIIIKEENRLTSKCYTSFTKADQKTVLGLIHKMRQNIEDDWYELKRYK